jgi:hypothetical protein
VVCAQLNAIASISFRKNKLGIFGRSRMGNFPKFPYPFPMIGPHQGKELELMLAGRKHLAIFGDAVPEDNIISEVIIPEKAFSPYVAEGKIIRFCEEVYIPEKNIKIRNVCFVSQNNEWRAHAYFWMQKECMNGRRPFDDAYEYFIGRLLGYDEADIIDFIKNVRPHL